MASREITRAWLMTLVPAVVVIITMAGTVAQVSATWSSPTPLTLSLLAAGALCTAVLATSGSDRTIDSGPRAHVDVSGDGCALPLTGGAFAAAAMAVRPTEIG